MNPLIPPMDPQLAAKLNPFMPPPAPSPSLGFQLWAQDPQNAMKVQPAMTAPDMPLQPNHPSNAPQMASYAPPQAQSPLMPPPSSDLSLPASPQSSLFSSPPPVVQSGAQAQLGKDTAEAQRLQQTGPGVNQIHNKGLRILGKIGDVAGSILAPGVSTFIPGTTMHNEALQSRAQNAIGRDQSAIASNLQNQKTALDIQQSPAELEIKKQNASLKGLQAQGSFAQHGLKVVDNGDGTTSVVPDEESPVYKQQQLKDQALQSQAEVAKATIELKSAQAELAKSKSDPNSPAFKLAQQRLAVAQQNASAAGTRAQAYMGRYLQSAYNTGLNGQDLPGATKIADEGGNELTVGTGNASQAAKSQANVAQFNDIDGATNSIEKAATNLVNKGGKLNDAKVAAAIADPESTAGQWAQGEFATQGLTPEQRDYVVQVKAYKENLQSLRKSAGGGVSDSQVDRLMALAPGAATPDLDYLKRQTDQIRQMRGRLAAGVTTAAGGIKVAGRPTPAKPAAPGTQAFSDNGVTYHIPAAQVAAFKKDHPNAR